MTEILTESFCERCGTRYTFESSAPRQRRLGGLKVIGRGLKNFVMSDDSSLDEAFAAARSDAERDATARQLDAFHATFNFCMSCRQYTCSNCWNEPEARCLSCAPLAVAEAIPVVDDVDPERLLRFMGSPGTEAPAPAAEPLAPHVHVSELIGDEVHEAEAAAEAAQAEAEAAEVAHAAEAEAAEAAEVAQVEAEAAAAEPVSELPAEPAEQPEMVAEPVVTEPQAEPEAEAEPAPGPGTGPEPAMVTEPEPEVAAEEPEASSAAAEAALGALEPGQNIDDAIAAYEASLATDAYAVAGEPAAVAEVLGKPEPEAAAEVRAEPEPVAAAEAVVTTEPPIEAEAPAEPATLMAPSPTETAAEPSVAAAEPSVAAAEPSVAAAEPSVAAAEPEPQPIAEAPAATPAEPEHAPEPEPEPLLAADAAEPAVPAQGVDVIQQPTWPAPAGPIEAPAEQPPVPSGPPSWPTGPRWPTAMPARSAPPPAAPAVDPLAALMAHSVTEAMWAASSRDVVQPLAAAQPTAAVQPCLKCGISLSATARFCRRCGTPQG